MEPLLVTRHWPAFPRALVRNLLTIIVTVQTLTALHKLDSNQVAESLGLLAVVGVSTACFTFRRRADLLDYVALCAMVAAGAGLHTITGHGQVYLCCYAAIVVSMWWYGLPWGLIPTVLGVAVMGTSAAYVDHGTWVAGLGQTAGAIGVALGVGYRRRGVVTARRNAMLSRQLRTSREAEERNAIAAERARLARELHDVLAHTLSSLSLHLESTRVLAKSRRVDPEVMARLDRAVSLARTGLDEARSAVGTLRDDALPGPARLPQLVADFGRDSGVTASFVEDGEPQPLAPEARVALFRAAQEGLTNVAKHAAASRVDVTLTWAADDVVLRIDDDGRGAAAGAGEGGNGLRGMRERAELAGGHVDAGSSDHGYVVVLRLPIESPVAAGAP